MKDDMHRLKKRSMMTIFSKFQSYNLKHLVLSFLFFVNLLAFMFLFPPPLIPPRPGLGHIKEGDSHCRARGSQREALGSQVQYAGNQSKWSLWRLNVVAANKWQIHLWRLRRGFCILSWVERTGISWCFDYVVFRI